MQQIGVLIAMITMDGFASANENPSIGPPVYSMVRFGAKESALIVRRKEWWRIISPTMLHAGIIHIVPNVAIQVSIFLCLYFYYLPSSNSVIFLSVMIVACRWIFELSVWYREMVMDLFL